MKETAIRFLRSTERYTKTDMVYLVFNGSWMLLAQAVSFLASLLLVYVFANYVGQDVYGEYKILLAISTILSSLILPGASAALIKAVSNNKSGDFILLLSKRRKYAIAVSALTLSIYIAYIAFSNETYAFWLVLSMIFFTSLASIFLLYQAYLNGLQQYKKIAIFSLMQRVGVVTLTAVIILVTNGNLLAIVLTFFGSTAFFTYLFYLITVKKYPTNNELSENVQNDTKNFSISIVIRNLASQFDKLLLGFFLGPVYVAQYAIAVAVPNEISTASATIMQTVLAKISKRKSAEVLSVIKSKIFFAFLFGLIFSIVYIIVSPFIFTYIFPEYKEIMLYSQLAALTAVISAPKEFMIQYWVAYKPNRIINFSVIELIATVVCLSLGMFFWGLLGAIIGQVIKNIIVFGYLYFYRKVVDY